MLDTAGMIQDVLSSRIMFTSKISENRKISYFKICPEKGPSWRYLQIL